MALLYILLGALVVGAVVFGVAALMTGADPGLGPADPNASAVPLPSNRPLTETDFTALRFDTGLRGYRMAQVDAALRRAAYDIGYKEELIAVLEAEVDALRSDRRDEADALQRARAAALSAEVSSGVSSEVEEAPVDAAPVDVAPVDVAPIDLAQVDGAPAAVTLEKSDEVEAAAADLDGDAPRPSERTAVGGQS